MMTGSYEYYNFKINNSDIGRNKPFTDTSIQKKYFPKYQQSTYSNKNCIKEKSG